jgi:D-glycero-alpha-D-manno-heptose-7-phosphate kinase
VIIEARAPTRVDLAGGTLDIHPIYLLEDDALTVNVAVDIPVRVRLSPARHGVQVVSRDLRQRLSAPSPDALPLGGPLDLVCRALRFAAPRPGLTVTLSSAAPPGSGLGASSALLVALLAALDRRARTRRPVKDLVLLAWRLEAQSLRTLTGRQDYLAAIHGGINAIRFGLAGDDVQPLRRGAGLRRALQERLVIAYTGLPHASGLTNWGMVRSYLDGTPSTVNHLRSIAEVAHAMRAALDTRDLDAVARLIAEEWMHRRELSSGVSTPVIERAMAVARRHGALAGKACGAGGGGCVLFFVRPGAKRYCEDALRTAGFAVLPSRIASSGLRVRARAQPA